MRIISCASVYIKAHQSDEDSPQFTSNAHINIAPFSRGSFNLNSHPAQAATSLMIETTFLKRRKPIVSETIQDNHSDVGAQRKQNHIKGNIAPLLRGSAVPLSIYDEAAAFFMLCGGWMKTTGR